MPGGQEPISFTVTLPFSLYGWSFFVAIVLAVALIAAATWAAHLWATREGRMKAFVARMDRLGLARREGDQPPKLHKFTWVLLPFAPVIAALVALAIGGAFSLLLVAIRGAPAVAPGEGSGVTSSAAAAGVLVVAILSAPFVIWRAIVAQKTVNVAEQGMITDRINKAVEGLGAEKTVDRIGRSVVVFCGSFRDVTYPVQNKEDFELPPLSKIIADKPLVPRYDEGTRKLVISKGMEVRTWSERKTLIEWLNEPRGIPESDHVVDRGDWQVFRSTAPNLEVRIGAIYALERIAQDSLRDHVQIMEILCAYIRENAPASQALALNLPQPPKLKVWDIYRSMNELEAWNRELRQAFATGGAHGGPIRPREDIQVALTVIGRRSARQQARESGGAPAFEDAVGAYPAYPVGGDTAAVEKWQADRKDWEEKLKTWQGIERLYRLDLRGTNLAGADMTGGRFDHANFAEARLEGAELYKAGLNAASLIRARLDGANLFDAQLNSANLIAASFNGALLSGAWLSGSNLARAELKYAPIGYARLDGAHLSDAELDGSSLVGASLNGTDLSRAQLNGADLSGAEFIGATLRRARLLHAIFRRTGLDEPTSFTNADMSTAVVKHVDLSEVALSTEQIVAMFGDASVTLPGGVTPQHPDWPAHWPKEDLDWFEFDKRWEAWKAEGGAVGG
jgi:uncharacterized protein YjbI with pentapeptide repeats